MIQMFTRLCRGSRGGSCTFSTSGSSTVPQTKEALAQQLTGKHQINNIQLSTLQISQAGYLPDGGDHLDIPIITRVITEWARGLLGGGGLQLQLLDETRVAAGALESLKFRKKIFQIIA